GAQALPGPRPLSLHLGPEADVVDGHAGLFGDLAREVDGEPEGVVKLECDVARKVAAASNPFELTLKERGSLTKRLAEALLFAAADVADEVALPGQLRIRRTHDLHYRVDELRHHPAFDPEHVRVAYRPPQHTTQHVPAAFVRGEHAIADEKGDGAAMVGQHSQ